MKTFKLGGIHPEENKISKNSPIEVIEAPETAYILMNQNLGAPSVPIVAKGDKVKIGQLIAKGEAFISASVHSPVSGTVAAVDTHVDATGYKRTAIIINKEGDEWVDRVDLSDKLNSKITASKEEILEIIKDSGIVGLGGATFPAHIKLMIPKDKKAEYLIINGVECEPYLTSDYRLMLEKADEIVVGVRLLMKALDVPKAIIGIENNKPDAIEHLKNKTVSYPEISVVPLKVKYPQGAEKQLIYSLVRREVPSGKLPIEVGCVVQNIGTTFAVYEAVQKNKPLIERIVTVTGKNVKKPSNFKVRIGTPVSTLIEKVGGMPEGSGKVLSGGPMMGKSLADINTSVVKGTSGIVIFDEKESKRNVTYNCIRCARCIDACPMGLQPYLLSNAVENNAWDIAEKNHVMDCIECGSCHYTCPSNRPLVDNLRIGKAKVGEIIRNRKN